jgi:PAS domain S-box-containing protein
MKTGALLVLAVDDDQEHLRLLQARLREALPEAGLVIAADGPQGIALARARDPDVILLDLVMPGIDGYEVCRQLKADERLRDIPVLVLSAALADRASRLAALAAGAEGFLAKPCEEPELVAQIRAMAKIKAANRLRRLETAQLEARVAERTRELTRELAARKHTEAALQESQRRLSEAQRMAQLGHWRWDVRTGAVEWSEEVFRIFRLDPATYTPHIDSIMALSPWPEDHARDQELIRRALETHEQGTYEQRFLRPDGSTGAYYSTFQGHYGEGGQLVAIVGTVMDITERKRTEQALRENEEKFRAIFEGSSAAIAIIKRDTTISMVNQEYCRVGRYDEQDVVGTSWTSQISPGDLERLTEYNRRRQLDPRDAPDHYEFRFTRKDGEIRTCLMNIAVLPKTQEFVASFVDITERKQAEEALRESERQLRLISDNARDAIWLMDLGFRTTWVSPSATRLRGYSLAELAEMPLEQQLTPSSLARALELSATVLIPERLADPSADIVVNVELEFCCKDGSTFSAESIIALLRDKEGRPTGFLGVGRDVSELRRAQQERERLQTSLAQSDRLTSMGMLAAGVAHEINNPLSYVLFNLESLAADLPGFTEGMRRCHAELTARAGAEVVGQLLGAGQEVFSPAALEDALERLGEAVSGAQRIRQIARSLGTFSRVEQAALAPVDVQASVEHALTMASNEIKYRARVVRDFAAVPAVLATEGKLAQVFLNLLINAAHAIPEGRVERNEIRVRTWAEGERVCVEVRDTGHGIAPELQEKIFEPFFTTKGVGVGSGLGLPICKSIVTGFGGEIGFESEPGRGARFTIRLPRVPGDWQKPGEPAPGEAPARPAVRGRILVVDDEAGIRASLARLVGRDHEVVLASSGEEGQALLEKDRRFDLVFCDLMMPKMSGMELHAWLAERDPALAGQVVFITGGAFTPGAAEYLARVGNLRVEKPFDSASLRKLAGELVLAARAKREG